MTKTKTRICPVCSGKFIVKRPWHRYCSRRCNNRASQVRYQRRARKGIKLLEKVEAEAISHD